MTMMPTGTRPSMAGPGFMGLGASPQGGMSPMTQALMMFGTGLLSGNPRTQGLARGFQGISQAYSPQAAMQRQIMQGQLEELQRRRAQDEAFKNYALGLPQPGMTAEAPAGMAEPALGGSLVDIPRGGTEPGQAQTAMTAPAAPPRPAGQPALPQGVTPDLLAALGPRHPLTQSIMAQMYKPQAAPKPTTLQQNLQAAGFEPGTPEYQARMAAAIPGATGAQREKAQDAAGFWRWVDTGERVFPDVSKPAEQPDPGDVGGMRKEFSSQSKDYRSVRTAFSKVQETAKNPSAAGDLALIFNYMKMLDPGSVVREGEFATAQSAAGVPTQVRNVYNRLVSGERLAPKQRQDFLNQAYNVYSAQASGQNLLEEQYRDLASRSGYDPENVVIDYQGNLRDMTPLGQAQTEAAAPSAPAQVSSQAEYDKLPSGAQYVAPDGKTRIKK